MVWNCGRRRLGRDYARNWDEEPHDRPRVLLESPDGAEAHATWKVLQRQGYSTMWCPGPRGNAAECALTATGHCPLVEKADAVVTALDLHDQCCEEVARRLDAEAPDKPVVVVASNATTAHWAEELPSCRVVAGPLSAKVLVRSLRVAGAPAPAVESA